MASVTTAFLMRVQPLSHLRSTGGLLHLLTAIDPLLASHNRSWIRGSHRSIDVARRVLEAGLPTQALTRTALLAVCTRRLPVTALPSMVATTFQAATGRMMRTTRLRPLRRLQRC